MRTVTIYEATNPSGAIFTARLEGVACKGEGRTVSDALHSLADELIGQSHTEESRSITVAALTDKVYDRITDYIDIPDHMQDAVRIAIREAVSFNEKDRIAGIGRVVNFFSEFSMPSCSTCGSIDAQKIVCTKCGGFLAEALEAYRGTPSGIAENKLLRKELTVVAPTNTGLDNPGTENGAANTYQVGGSHYKTAIEHWDYVIANDIPYLEAQVIKYLTRWRKKNGMEDVLKSRHYLDKLIEVETGKKKGSV